jgi:VWFA-related protein
MKLAAVAIVVTAAVAVGQADKKMFVSVIDAAGKPVSDVTAADFAVREDGAEREVTGMRPSSEPLSVALLVDTTAGTERYLVGIRNGLTAFVRDVLTRNPNNEIAVWEFGVAAQRVRDFTSDAATLEKSVGQIYARSDAGSVLLETIYLASEALARRPSPRRAIVVFNVEPSVELTERQPQGINESLMKSRAQLWTVSLQRGLVESGGRDALLTSLVRNAGGVRERILADNAIERYMRLYATALASQYEVTYRRPSGSAKVVQTGIRRDGAKIIAGLFAPQ